MINGSKFENNIVKKTLPTRDVLCENKVYSINEAVQAM